MVFETVKVSEEVAIGFRTGKLIKGTTIAIFPFVGRFVFVDLVSQQVHLIIYLIKAVSYKEGQDAGSLVVN